MNTTFRFIAPLMLAMGASAVMAQSAEGLTRAQVQAEAREAARQGLLDYREGEAPRLAVAAPTGEQKTRAQVRAEAREAARLGLLEYREGEAPRVATAEQAEQIRLAGLRAVDSSQVTAQGGKGASSVRAQ